MGIEDNIDNSDDIVSEDNIGPIGQKTLEKTAEFGS
jgi:hypothetical protein